MRERAVSWAQRHPLMVPGLYLIAYMVVFLLLEEMVTPKYIISSTLDAYIPFRAGFVVPYVLWFPLVPGVFYYFYRRDRESYWRLCRLILIGLTVCLAIYALLPNGLNLRRPITGDGFCERLVALIRGVDTATNVCPSIHVFVSVSIGIVAWSAKALQQHPASRWVLETLVVLICLSTVYLKQHSVVDVACGVALSFTLSSFLNRRMDLDAALSSRTRKRVALQS